MKKKLIISLFLIISVLTNMQAQNAVVKINHKDCLNERQTLGKINNQIGYIMCREGIITYKWKKRKNIVVPCNLPTLKTNQDSVQVIFSGKIKASHPAIKTLGANIVLSKLLILNF